MVLLSRGILSQKYSIEIISKSRQMDNLSNIGMLKQKPTSLVKI
jgi:hypothetical protein